ncbi:unnamed protein product, partial [Laminaria digitata]
LLSVKCFPQDCLKFYSKKSGATHMGQEGGIECFCGSYKDEFNVYGGAKCEMPCVGDSGSVCGGPLALSSF